MRKISYRYLYTMLVTVITSFYMTYNVLTSYDILTISNLNSIRWILKTGWLDDYYVEWGFYTTSILYYPLYSYLGVLFTRLILSICLIIILIKYVDLGEKSYLIPLIMLSLYTGDLLTPILVSILYLARGVEETYKDAFGVALGLHEPILALPFIYRRAGEKRFYYTGPYSVFLIATAYVYRYRYINGYKVLLDPWILAIIASTYLIYFILRRLDRYAIYAVLAMPITILGAYLLSCAYNRLDKKRDWGKIEIIALILLVLAISTTPVIYSYQAGNPMLEINPGIEEFIANHVNSGDTVLLATADPNIMKILVDNDNHIIYYGDARDWNWSDRSEVSRRIREMISISYSKCIRYIIMEKGRFTSDWFPSYTFKEYKIGYNIPKDTFLIILENKYIPQRTPYFHPLKIYNSTQEHDVLRSNYNGYWANTTLNITQDRNMGIRILGGNESYSVYLKFSLDEEHTTNEDNIVIISVENPQGLRHIEIYGDAGEKLAPLWKDIDTGSNATYVLGDIDLRGYIGIQLRIDSRGNTSIKELQIHPTTGDMIWTGFERGKILVKNGIDAYQTVKPQFIDDIAEEFILQPGKLVEITLPHLDGYIIYMAILIALATLVIGLLFRYPSTIHTRKTSDTYIFEERGFRGLLLLAAATPIIIYLGYTPQLLEISWIGGGALVYAYIMTIVVYTLYKPIEKQIPNKKLINILLISIPVLTTLSTIVKRLYLWNIKALGTWYIEAYFSLIDTGIYAILYTFIGYIIFRSVGRGERGGNIIPFIPALYLWTMSLIYFIDLTRVIPSEIFMWIMYLSAYGSKAIAPLYGMGIRILSEAGPYGLVIDAYSPNGGATVILGWPCTGITGIFLFTAFMSIEYLVLIRGRGVSNRFILATYLFGLGMTIFLNIVRITAIIYLTINYGINIGEVFHSIGYELIFLFWIVIYMFIVDRLSYRLWKYQ